jgi:predicted flap endonuclease-1-like 5' DNA nuclease
MTKLGAGGKIYKYSGNPNGTYGSTFTIVACDAHLFVGPFDITPLNVEPVVAQPAVEIPQPAPVPVPPMPEHPTPPEAVVSQPVDIKVGQEIGPPVPEGRLEQKDMEVIEYEPDDFTLVKGIGDSSNDKLHDAGITYYDDLLDASDDELSHILRIGKKQIGRIKDATQRLLDKLIEEEEEEG